MTNIIYNGITPGVAPTGHHEFCGCGPFYSNPICVAKIKKIAPSWYYAHVLRDKKGKIIK